MQKNNLIHIFRVNPEYASQIKALRHYSSKTDLEFISDALAEWLVFLEQYFHNNTKLIRLGYVVTPRDNNITLFQLSSSFYKRANSLLEICGYDSIQDFINDALTEEISFVEEQRSYNRKI